MAMTYKSFADLEGDFINEETLFRLLHFWESHKFTQGNILMGLEVLLIDEKSTVVQGFISKGRMGIFEPHLKANSVYKMSKFTLINPKTAYKVSDHKHIVCFTDQTKLAAIETEGQHIPTQHFRLRQFEDFAAIIDTHENLYDVIGHIRVIDGDNIHFPHTCDGGTHTEEGLMNAKITVHLQLKDGTAVRVRLWEKITATFRKRCNESITKPSVLLVTIVNPNKFQGAINLSSTSSTRIFIDNDIEATKQYMTWLGEGGESSLTVTNSTNLAKVETVTLQEIHDYISKQTNQEVNFICTAKIVDILQQYGWYYISCSNCNKKVTKTATTLRCYDCNKPNIVGIVRYRFELSVRDNDGEATFVILDSEGAAFTGRTATELRNELLKRVDAESLEKTTTQCILDLIGRTCKFEVKITKYNFKATRQTISVSEVLEKNVVVADPHVEIQAEEVILDSSKDSKPAGKGKKGKCTDAVGASGNNKDKRIRTS